MANNIPKIDKGVVDSIIMQQNRSDTLSYLADLLDELEKENPVLFGSIVATATNSSSRIGDRLFSNNVNEKEVNYISYTIKYNMLNIAACVYNAIKQQIIINNLE